MVYLYFCIVLELFSVPRLAQDEYERRYADGATDEIDAAAASGLETDPSCIFRQGLTYSVRDSRPP